jgi:hypothetical protein
MYDTMTDNKPHTADGETYGTCGKCGGRRIWGKVHQCKPRVRLVSFLNVVGTECGIRETMLYRVTGITPRTGRPWSTNWFMADPQNAWRAAAMHMKRGAP